MKTTILALMALLAAAPLARAASADACESATYNFAVNKQHEDYNARQWKKQQPEFPKVEQNEVKSSGFESWYVSYNIDEECLEGYELLVRRSADGKRCAVIKLISDLSRDCG